MITYRFALIQLATMLMFSLVIFIFQGWSNWFQEFFSGAVLITFSLIIQNWALVQIFSKKLIAIAVGVIVIKWAILLILIFTVFRHLTNPMAFVFGISTITASALVWAIVGNNEQDLEG